MNRNLRKQSMKRCAFRKRGGGFSTGPALLPIPTDDWSYTQKELVNQPYDDCAIPSRTGQLFNQPNPGLAQVVMAGGGAANSWGTWDPALNPELAQRAMAGGAGWDYKPNLGPIQTPMAGGGWDYKANLDLIQTPMAGGACGCSVPPAFVGGRRKSTRRMRGGACPCMMQSAGKRKNRNNRRTFRKMRGGMWRAVAVDPSVSVGGDGPNVAALHAGVPCDARAGTPNMLSNDMYMPDPRAPTDVYSLTPNQQAPSVQAGGAYSTGNGFSEACYTAPGSMLPKYEAETAGFHFRPSTEFGSTLPDGVTAYNDVVPVAARLGGGKKRNTRRKAKKNSRKANRKAKNSRKH